MTKPYYEGYFVLSFFFFSFGGGAVCCLSMATANSLSPAVALKAGVLF